jgi:hypothetical protein
MRWRLGAAGPNRALGDQGDGLALEIGRIAKLWNTKTPASP